MHRNSVSRRRFLGSSAVVFGSAAALARPGHAQAPAPVGTPDSNLASALGSDYERAYAAQAGLAHKGQVRRAHMPALHMDFVNNPHRRPVGAALSRAEQHALKTRVAALRSVSGNGL